MWKCGAFNYGGSVICPAWIAQQALCLRLGFLLQNCPNYSGGAACDTFAEKNTGFLNFLVQCALKEIFSSPMTANVIMPEGNGLSAGRNIAVQ